MGNRAVAFTGHATMMANGRAYELHDLDLSGYISADRVWEFQIFRHVQKNGDKEVDCSCYGVMARIYADNMDSHFNLVLHHGLEKEEAERLCDNIAMVLFDVIT